MIDMHYKLNHIYNEDCLFAMLQIPDEYFDLAIVDPPYGQNNDGGKIGFAGKMRREGTTSFSMDSQLFTLKQWDKRPPNEDYFMELMRVSKNQIIWGCNYFDHVFLGGRIFWDKKNGQSNFSDGEIAFNSCNKSIRKFSYRWHGFFKEKMGPNAEHKIHPTQKPVDLYKWLLSNYAKEGDKILDTHVGSGSSIIACIDMGFDYMGFEIDEDYYKAMQDRIYHFTRQEKLI